MSEDIFRGNLPSVIDHSKLPCVDSHCGTIRHDHQVKSRCIFLLGAFGAGSAADILEGHAGAALRALAFVMFLALPLSWLLVLVFAASLGFLWLGTVPLTSGLVGYMSGPTHLSMLWGIVFFSHQLGSFLGGWGAGRIYDLRGDYGLMWWISVGLGVSAALLHWRIRERPVPRLAIAEGTA